MPEALRVLLSRVRFRLRLRAVAHAAAIGGAIFAGLVMVSVPFAVAVATALAVAAVTGVRQSRIARETSAHWIESKQPLDNLVVTAVELDGHPRPVRSEIRDAIFQQAAARAAEVNAASIVPLGQPLAVAAAVGLGCILLAGAGGVSRVVRDGARELTPVVQDSNVITVRVMPPPYTRRSVETHENPTQLTVITGSRVRAEAASGRVLREWVAAKSESLELHAGENMAPRFLSVVVVPDAPPTVRIVEPGRDSAFATPTGSLRIGVESRDDLGLASLALRYTKASGGGENVTFTEGEVPLNVQRVNDRLWQATANWVLDPLGLADGDVVVYRAVSRDRNPGGEVAESDAFLVEIGRAAEIASAGFALPSEEKKYAISQQMVIYKTEQLLADRARHPNDWLEQTRMIGVEQRMVRAEVVFLSGGEVEDEVEEAAHSHELAEGRLENQGRAEMVRALNFMSRAEAQLNDGNAADALVFERQALASLERALDRRRYFLRTLPDRSRIDTTRRLTGERREARSWVRQRTEPTAAANDRLRAAMQALIDASADPSQVNGSLAARVAAVDPESAALQKAAVTVANAQSSNEKREAVRAAMQAVTSHALSVLPGSSPLTVPADPLAGRLGATFARPPQ